MPIGINHSVVYIDYSQKVWQNKVTPVLKQFTCTIWRKKVMFYSLMEKGMLKKIKIAGLAFTVTNKYHTKDNLRSLQSSIITLCT